MGIKGAFFEVEHGGLPVDGGTDPRGYQRVAQQRDDVRHICKQNCALIEATKDIEELEALIKAPAEVVKDPKAKEPVMIPNPAPHLNPLPSIDVSEYLTLKTL